jgi:hypothetical protein
MCLMSEGFGIATNIVSVSFSFGKDSEERDKSHD